MGNLKDLFLKHGLVILAIISIIVLALPFYTVESVASADVGDFEFDIDVEPIETKISVSGFDALKNSVFAYILIIGPALLVAMNYIKQLEKYKGVLAIAVPMACIVSMIIIFLTAKSSYLKVAGGVLDVEVGIGLGSGSILAFISYVASIICGAMTYHNFTLDKAGIERLKNVSLSLVENAQTAIGNGAQMVSSKVDNNDQSNNKNKESNLLSTPNYNNQPVFVAQKTQKRSSSNTEEVLVLIERLSKMKDIGILTEEEFSDKKKKLLEEI